MFRCPFCNKDKYDYIVKADISIHRGNCITSWAEDSKHRKKCIECFIREVSFPIDPENRDYTHGL